MTAPAFFFVLAFGLSVYELVQSKGRSALAWACALISTGLIYPILKSL